MISPALLLIMWFTANHFCQSLSSNNEEQIQNWLAKYNLMGYKHEANKAVFVLMIGCTSVVQCVNLWAVEDLPHLSLPKATLLSLKQAAIETKRELLFAQFLKEHSLLNAKTEKV